jgi:hypothetical protein
MKPTPAGLMRTRPIQWMLVWTVAKGIWETARDRVNENLTEKERRDFRELLTKSKGRPNKLSERERRRFTRVTKKAATGDPNASWPRFGRSVATLLPPRAVTQLISHRKG